MAKERSLTQLELLQATVSGQAGWVDARWTRADGSTGSATVYLRLKTAERWYIARLLLTEPTTALLRDVPLERITAAANADPMIRAWIKKSYRDKEIVMAAEREAANRPRMKRPNRRPLDDAFYAQVGLAYKAAAAAGLSPAKTLALESDTPQGTVNRWIAEARRRGYLPPGEPGKVVTA